ncbi:MAG: hypothetical protein QM750_20000 [Rubrivivax sp.]
MSTTLPNPRPCKGEVRAMRPEPKPARPEPCAKSYIGDFGQGFHFLGSEPLPHGTLLFTEHALDAAVAAARAVPEDRQQQFAELRRYPLYLAVAAWAIQVDGLLRTVLDDLDACASDAVLQNREWQPQDLGTETVKALARARLDSLRSRLAMTPMERQAHSDDAAVDRFAAAMKEKLAEARKRGRAGWETCAPADLSRMLRAHVEKGDPRDVANFCCFLWSLAADISAPEPAQTDTEAAHPHGDGSDRDVVSQLCASLVAAAREQDHP